MFKNNLGNSYILLRLHARYDLIRFSFIYVASNLFTGYIFLHNRKMVISNKTKCKTLPVNITKKLDLPPTC